MTVAGPPAVLELDTPHGPARAHLYAVSAEPPRAALVLGHGAGGGVGAPDLGAVTAATVAAGYTVALIEQPYRVAGRRSAAPARQLDAAWIAVAAALSAGPLTGVPLIVGGRSSGARVACRTAAETAAAGVLCLAFPLLAPSRGGRERVSRLPELDAVEAPVLVIQGVSDRFGMPPPATRRTVVQVQGDHALRKDRDTIIAATLAWLG